MLDASRITVLNENLAPRHYLVREAFWAPHIFALLVCDGELRLLLLHAQEWIYGHQECQCLSASNNPLCALAVPQLWHSTSTKCAAKMLVQVCNNPWIGVCNQANRVWRRGRLLWKLR